MTPEQLALYFDHTQLKPTADAPSITKLCNEAIEYSFFGVCVQPWYVDHCRRLLEKTPVKLVTVIGFPLGSNVTSVKITEARQAMDDGADELDWVVALPGLMSGDYGAVLRDLDGLAELKAVRKVILETCYLDQETIAKLSTEIAAREIEFVKTSTGFGSRGASLEDIVAMKAGLAKAPFPTQIKASGGIRNLADCHRFIDAGVARIGASASVAILGELNS